MAVSTSVFDIIALVETNLSPDINDSELELTGVSVFKFVRSHLSSRKSDGDGLLINCYA